MVSITDFKYKTIDVQIERAKDKDIENILLIQKRCGLAEWSSNQYREEIDKLNSLVLVAKIDDKIAGFLTARFVLGESDLLNIGVPAEYQKVGIGTLLIGSLLDAARKMLVECVWLEVRESNLNAVNFYEKIGFRRVQTRKYFYTQPIENALVMKCELQKITSKISNKT